MFKLAYAFGLRLNEVRHLQVVDFSSNPKAPQFGRFGCLQVRHGKAMAGSAPKRRSVLTVFDWSVEVAQQWLEVALPALGGGTDVFPSERGTLLGLGSINEGSPVTATSSGCRPDWTSTRCAVPMSLT